MKNRQETIKHLRSLGELLDSRFKGPFGTKFGLDGVLGLIPGVGDIITTGLSVYIIAQAAALGVGSSTLIRMTLNVVLENAVDLIPIAGNFFDFFWKSNSKNLILLEKHLAHSESETFKSRAIVIIICCIMLALLVASGYVSFLVIKTIVSWFFSMTLD